MLSQVFLMGMKLLDGRRESRLLDWLKKRVLSRKLKAKGWFG
jgi:hypothetical protein